MPKKRKAFVHVGLDDGSGDFVERSLDTHGRALLELGVRRPAESTEQMFRAAVEILRSHKAWGYRRDEVEGAWTDVVRAGLKGRETLVFSQTMLASARPEQAALLVDALRGFEVHVVVTASAPSAWTVPGEAAHDLGAVLEVWARAVDSPDQLHVIVAGDRRTTWKAFGRVVGFGTSSLKVADVAASATRARPPHLALASRSGVLDSLGRSWVELLAASEHDVVGDPATLVPDLDPVGSPESGPHTAAHALTEALAEVERLTRRTESLERRLESAEKKRKKLKRKLTIVA